MRENRLHAAVIALLLVLVVGSAAVGYQRHRAVLILEKQLEDATEAKKKELETAQKKWAADLSASDRRLAPILRERDHLRARLRDIDAKKDIPFVPPGSDDEIVKRFRGLGYEVAISPK